MRSFLTPILVMLVLQGPFRFQLTPKNPASLASNQKVQMQMLYGSFRALGRGAGKDISGATSWSGSDATVATVSASGLVSPTGNGGTVTVTGVTNRFKDSSVLVFPAFTCSGENYDVNNNIFDGCEVADLVTGNHTQATATNLGTAACMSLTPISGRIPSDSRVHNPAISGFDSVTGSAPDFYLAVASGGFTCNDNYSVTFTTTGGGNTACYKATITTDKGTNSVTVNGHGSSTMSGGSGSYTDGATLNFKIEKTCSLPVQENVSYAVDLNL